MSIIDRRLNLPNHLAEDCSISGVFHVIDPKLINLIAQNKINPKPLLICSGGTSSRCAAEGHWTLDLRKKYNQVYFSQQSNEVEIEAGVKMGDVLNELYKKGKSFPIGLSKEIGMGYILTGGISPISRSKGLAIDQIVKIKGYWGTGEPLEISRPSQFSSIEEKCKWRALSGAAHFLAIITSITVKTQNINPPI